MRAQHLAMAALVGMGRKTLTNLLVTAGQQFQDCSAAQHVIQNHPNHEALSKPVWQKKGNSHRPSFQHIVQSIRAELWAPALGIHHFSDFATHHARVTNTQKYKPNVADAVFYACNRPVEQHPPTEGLS